MVCCCFRFRIPRTKQQIEADYKRRKITTKFRQQLETIQDAQMDTISLKDGNIAHHGTVDSRLTSFRFILTLGYALEMLTSQCEIVLYKIVSARIVC